MNMSWAQWLKGSLRFQAFVIILDFSVMVYSGTEKQCQQSIFLRHIILISKLSTKEICSFVIAYLVKWHFGRVKRRFVGPKSDIKTRNWKLCWASSFHLLASNLGFILCYHPSRYPKRVPINRFSYHSFVCIFSPLSELHDNLLRAFALRILCSLFEWRKFPWDDVHILSRAPHY
jgi:hypothetical protein